MLLNNYIYILPVNLFSLSIGLVQLRSQQVDPTKNNILPYCNLELRDRSGGIWWDFSAGPLPAI